jgi:peroxiredoxin Q/BCP
MGLASHEKFKQQYKLPFILLSDEIKKFKIVWCTKALFGILPGRVTYVMIKWNHMVLII